MGSLNKDLKPTSTLGSQIEQYYNKFKFSPISKNNFDDDDKDGDHIKEVKNILLDVSEEDVINFIKTIEPKHIWDFFYDILYATFHSASLRRSQNSNIFNIFHTFLYFQYTRVFLLTPPKSD